ncbi:hypothetical protein Bmul_5096 [Burkholderia multivorans ATCC 17616]|nr:hypothetical protein Bmul_5096 [Burkholderia multivorans ATCC 17616]
MNARLPQLERRERRRREVRGHAVLAADQRLHRLRMRQVHRDRIELREMRGAELAARDHLQHDRRQRRANARHRDPVGPREVAQRREARAVCVQRQRRRRQPADADHFDVRNPAGARPQLDEARRAGASKVERAGHHRVVDRVAAVEQHPVDRDVAHPVPRRVPLEQPLLLHHEQRQIQHAIAFGDPHRARLRAHERRRAERAQHAEAGRDQRAAARARRHARTLARRSAGGGVPRRAFVVLVTCCMLASPLVLMPSSHAPARHRLSSESEKMLTSRPRENP